MAYIAYNPNPQGKSAGDCVVRCLTKAMNWDWETAYAAVCAKGLAMSEMPSANIVWMSLLNEHGYEYHALDSNCLCGNYTVRDFCKDHPKGEFILGMGDHVVYCNDGSWWDLWNSGKCIPIYYFSKPADNKEGEER